MAVSILWICECPALSFIIVIFTVLVLAMSTKLTASDQYRMAPETSVTRLAVVPHRATGIAPLQEQNMKAKSERHT